MVSGPNRGQGPVEWGNFPSICPSIQLPVHPSIHPSFHPSICPSFCPSICPSVGSPSGLCSQAQRPTPSQPGLKPDAWLVDCLGLRLARFQAWLAGLQAWLAGLQAWLDCQEGGMDGRTDGWVDGPRYIHMVLVPCWGRCPKRRREKKVVLAFSGH